MMFKNPNPVGALRDSEDKLDPRYYEDVGDPLAQLRALRQQHMPQQAPGQQGKGSDPFTSDPDWQQHLREERMNEKQSNYGW